MSDFITDCLTGDALLEEIDDYVDNWHDSQSKLSLQDFLGMTNCEYGSWVANPNCLPRIVIARRYNSPFTELSQECPAKPIAARSGNREHEKDLIKWLQNTGLWE